MSGCYESECQKRKDPGPSFDGTVWESSRSSLCHARIHTSRWTSVQHTTCSARAGREGSVCRVTLAVSPDTPPFPFSSSSLTSLFLCSKFPRKGTRNLLPYQWVPVTNRQVPERRSPILSDTFVFVCPRSWEVKHPSLRCKLHRKDTYNKI